MVMLRKMHDSQSDGSFTILYYGSMKPNWKGICGKRMGEIPNVGPNPTASTISTISFCWLFLFREERKIPRQDGLP